ncbi:MAG: ABC transporter substrate-binding protein [Candidatus Bathyarchaeota archaeon]
METKSVKIIFLVFILSMVVVAGIIVLPELIRTQENVGPLTIVDDYERNVTITNYPPKRIISLAPSCTEIIFALNLENKLVGVDTYDYYPEEIQQKIESSNIMKVGQYADISTEPIVSLNPDLVIAAMTVQLPIIENLAAVGESAMIINPENYDDVLSDILLVGEATGANQEAEELVNSIQSKTQEIFDKTKDETRPRVYIEYAFNGGFQSFGSGSFADELINKAGGKNIFINTLSAYISANSEEIIVSNPEIIIISKGAMAEACGLTPSVVKNRPGWDQIDAIKNNQIYEIDERLLLPGAAMVDSLDSMARIVHPEIFE